MRILIIGTSLSGKTTIIRSLRADTQLPILEIDEELTRMNNGEYPTDNKQIFVSQIITDILSRDNIIFFTNTDYFTVEDIENARRKGFKIIQLSLSLEELQKRNKIRVEKEGYADMSQWLNGMVDYQTMINDKNLVDKIIDANQTTENIAEELTEYLETLPN